MKDNDVLFLDADWWCYCLLRDKDIRDLDMQERYLDQILLVLFLLLSNLKKDKLRDVILSLIMKTCDTYLSHIKTFTTDTYKNKLLDMILYHDLYTSLKCLMGKKK